MRNIEFIKVINIDIQYSDKKYEFIAIHELIVELEANVWWDAADLILRGISSSYFTAQNICIVSIHWRQSLKSRMRLTPVLPMLPVLCLPSGIIHYEFHSLSYDNRCEGVRMGYTSSGMAYAYRSHTPLSPQKPFTIHMVLCHFGYYKLINFPHNDYNFSFIY